MASVSCCLPRSEPGDIICSRHDISGILQEGAHMQTHTQLYIHLDGTIAGTCACNTCMHMCLQDASSASAAFEQLDASLCASSGSGAAQS
eukprot:scaffold25044_cov21-Tisochrysis_lutea.AAC.1